MRISLDSLRVLDAIERNNSFAAAAEELNRVPSAVTYAMKQLEQELEVSLFDRTGYRAHLTQVGKDLLNGGRLLLEQAQLLERKVRIAAGVAVSSLQIAYDDALDHDTVFGPLGSFLESFPDTSLCLTAEILNGCSDALQHGGADLVIGAFSELPTNGSYRFEELRPMQFVFAVAPHHPLAQCKEPLTQKDIVAHRIVKISDTAKTIPKSSSGYTPDRRFLTVPSMASKVKAQIAGLGIGFVPLSQAKSFLDSGELVQKEVDRPKAGGRCFLAWNADRMTASLDFLINLYRSAP